MPDQYFEIAPNEEYGVVQALSHKDQRRSFSFRLSDPGRLDAWPNLQWQLPSNDRPDVVWALGGIRMVSPLIKRVFTEEAGPRDAIQWIPSSVLDADGVEHPYFVPHFPVHEDVLDERHTTIGPGGLPIRWVLARTKVTGLAVFIIPRLTLRYVIHERVGAALAAASASGYTSQPARAV